MANSLWEYAGAALLGLLTAILLDKGYKIYSDYYRNKLSKMRLDA